MAEEYCIVVTAVPDRDTARAIATALLHAKLAAGVQIVGPVESHYWWQGAIRHGEEVLCLCRARAARYSEVEAAILALHPYVTPEVTALPIVAGSRDFLAWIAASTS